MSKRDPFVPNNHGFPEWCGLEDYQPTTFSLRLHGTCHGADWRFLARQDRWLFRIWHGGRCVHSYQQVWNGKCRTAEMPMNYVRKYVARELLKWVLVQPFCVTVYLGAP